MSTSRRWKEDNAVHVRNYSRKYRAEKIASDPQWTSKNWKAWRKKHPEAEYHARHRRASRHRGAPGRASTEQISARLDYYGRLCWVCAAPMQQVDHVKPLAKGGSNWPSNLRPICKPCNVRKRDLWPYNRDMGKLKAVSA